MFVSTAKRNYRNIIKQNVQFLLNLSVLILFLSTRAIIMEIPVSVYIKR